MKKNKTDRKSDWEKDFVERLTKWYQNQTGHCACLGDCERCGHHLCHGCACWMLDEIENLLSKQREQLIEEMHAVLNYELTENFDGMGWNNDGWKDELFEAINSAINKLNKLGD